MSGLLGFLVASTIFALIGTAVRGLLRPLSWGLLALAAGLFISNRMFGIPGSPTEEIANQTTSSAPVSTSGRPIAQEGWQDVARELEAIYSNTLANTQESATRPSATESAAATGDATDRETGDRNVGSIDLPERASSRQNTSPDFSSPSSPIPGFW